MKFIARLAVLFYVLITVFIVLLLALIAFNIVPLNDVTTFVSFVYSDASLRIIFATAALVLFILNYVFWGVLAGDQQMGEIIAFDNPSGRVTVSLSALEDLIRRVISRTPEVKEVKSSISAGKKSLSVETRLILNADVNIPEMTSKVQDIVKRKIQDMIGLEETVVVRVHVVKIIPEMKSRQSKVEEKKEPEVEKAVPFQGYRA